MSRPHVAALVEDAWHRQLERGLRRRGWQNRIIGHVGYGSPSFIRVFGRVLLGRARDEGGDSDEPDPTYGGMRSPFLRDREARVRRRSAEALAASGDAGCRVLTNEARTRPVSDPVVRAAAACGSRGGDFSPGR